MATGGGPAHLVDMDEDLMLKEASGVVGDARSRGITLRLLGAMAVYAHSKDSQSDGLMKQLGRFENKAQLFTDLDLAGYGKQRKDIGKFLEQRGFRPAMTVNAFFGNRRLIYYHPESKYNVDVFLDKLEFSHDVNFGDKPGDGRLELDFPTITLADIVLEKLQIHHINRKDLVDLAVLFAGHEVGEGNSGDTVDGAHISRVLSDDWGFWYDSVSNLNKLKEFASEMAATGKLSSDTLQVITGRTDRLLSMVEGWPKSGKWKKRGESGTRKPWYREVEDVTR